MQFKVGDVVKSDIFKCWGNMTIVDIYDDKLFPINAHWEDQPDNIGAFAEHELTLVSNPFKVGDEEKS
jgi:hypothetical protein